MQGYKYPIFFPVCAHVNTILHKRIKTTVKDALTYSLKIREVTVAASFTGKDLLGGKRFVSNSLSIFVMI